MAPQPPAPQVYVHIVSINQNTVTIAYSVVASPGDILSHADVIWGDGATTPNLPAYSGTAFHPYQDGGYAITVNVYRGSDIVGSSSIQIRV